MKRDSFGSSFGVLVALIGSAVGLGNLWRFPYLMGENGGAAFIIVYLCFALVICLPIMICEFVVGRRSQSNAFGAFKFLAPGTKWKNVGLLNVLASAVVLSFYSVVGGWSIKYLVLAFGQKFTMSGGEASEAIFNSFVGKTYESIMYTLFFLLSTGAILVAGVKKGIEKFAKVMMPLLFVLMIVISVKSMTLPGASEGIKYLFKPDFSKFTASSAMAAMGQAFFSLSLGCGTVLTYASYVSKKENIVRCTSLTALFDALFSLIAGCAIIPAVFAFGISPGQGPGLVFVTLPAIFAELPAGAFIGILFFISLFLAAITSSVSLLEVVIAFLMEERKMKRKAAVDLSMAIFAVLAILCSLSDKLFNLFDFVSSNILMTLGALFVVIFVGQKMSKIDFEDEISNGGQIVLKRGFLRFLYFIIRFVAPIIVVGILLAGLI